MQLIKEATRLLATKDDSLAKRLEAAYNEQLRHAGVEGFPKKFVPKLKSILDGLKNIQGTTPSAHLELASDIFELNSALSSH